MNIDLDFLLKKYFTEGELTDDCKYIFNIFTDDNEEFQVQKIKKHILSLKKYELIIFLLYADTHCYSDVAKKIGVSANTIRTKMIKIKKEIIEKIKNDKC